jgi:hypothetical protein
MALQRHRAHTCDNRRVSECNMVSEALTQFRHLAGQVLIA